MNPLAAAAFAALDKLDPQSMYDTIPEADFDKRFPDRTTITVEQLYNWRSLESVYYIDTLSRLKLFRGLTENSAGQASMDFPVMTSKLACIKLGFAECGEANQMVIFKFCSHKKFNGKLLVCSLSSSSSSLKNHCFSILVGRDDSSKIDGLKVFGDVQRLLPEACIIDAFFRESGVARLVGDACPRLFHYIEDIGLDLFSVEGVLDSKDSSLREIPPVVTRNSDELVERIRKLPRAQFDEVKVVRDLYLRDVKNIFPKGSLRPSGPHLYTYASTRGLMPICAKLDERGIEYSIHPPLTQLGRHFIIVDGVRES